jgi:DNA repair protein RecO (recombination protein O)
MTPVLQPGAPLSLEWTARLEEHIGTFRVDPIAARTAAIMADRAALAALGAITALVAAALPERDAHPELYARSLALIEALAAAPDWPARYAAWELALLTELGFGLDLARCAVTGATNDLAYVSPKSGRAVSRAGAGQWADRLLPLPAFLRTAWNAPPPSADLAAALALTGFFLDARLAPTLPRQALPEARGRAVDAILRAARKPR